MRRLIESVRNYPCLWKTDIEDYKLHDVREAAWVEIVKACDLPDVKEAKTLWRKLRDGHRQAISRKKTGQAANSKKMWKYEKVMDFLLPTMKNRSRTSNLSRQDSNDQESDASQHSENVFVSEQHHTVDYILPPKKKVNLTKLNEHERNREVRSAESDTQQILYNTNYKNTNNVENTALGNFFMSMLQTTSALPESLQLRVQRQLFNIVMEAKEEDMANRRHWIVSTDNNSSAPGSASTAANAMHHYKTSPRAASTLSNYSDD